MPSEMGLKKEEEVNGRGEEMRMDVASAYAASQISRTSNQ